MLKLPILPTPNQSLVYSIGGRRWAIDLIKGQNNTTLVSVTIDDTAIITCQSVVPGADILFTPDLARYGQIFFICEDNDEVLDWRKFGSGHDLYWAES